MMKPENEIPTMWTAREAAGKTGVSYDHILRLCREGKVAYIKVGTKRSKFLINADSLINLLMQGEIPGNV